MLKKAGTAPGARSPVPPGSRRALWALAVLDVGVVAWMAAMGEWFDSTSRLTAVVTLGGNHLLVLWLAVAGFAILAALAPLTGGFTVVAPWQMVLIAAAGAVSVVALGGMLSIAALIWSGVLAAALLGRAFLWRP
jgi:hypothetical protein